MGARAGSGKRFEAPYTFEIETPHVNGRSRSPGGPIRLLAVPTVAEGRTLVELAERLSLDLTTVSIDPDLGCQQVDHGVRRRLWRASRKGRPQAHLLLSRAGVDRPEEVRRRSCCRSIMAGSN